MVTKEIELSAGRAYRLEIEYANTGLDPQVQLLWSPPGVNHLTQALEAAEQADVIVAVMGLSPAVEGEEMPVELDGFSGGDRTEIHLPAVQAALLRRLHAMGKPVVLVLINGGALALDWEVENIPAILEAWYPGQEGGLAVAEVLFGDVNPSGKLPVTFYRSLEDLPPFEDYGLEGHTYRYLRNEPLFPFGYGLSYTLFDLGELQIEKPEVEVGSGVRVRLEVVNVGDRAGEEVVQLYTRLIDVEGYRPNMELKGFSRVCLEPGQRKTVCFSLHASQVGYHNSENKYVVSPGNVEVMVGNSSGNLPLKGKFQIVGDTAQVCEAPVYFSQTTIEEE
jgi:beta-glucosidase